ncbi:MAG TPA: hypothetical protein VEJ86_01060, partial [Candidatus Binataceae bacterium]|nr:hypothetical protein [Candidatus Binataceae bacterium]
ESALAMKSAIVLCDVALAAALMSSLIASNRSPWWVVAYAWNPLVAIEGAGNGHVDLLGALCLVLAVSALARGKRAVSAVTFALAVGVKFLPLTLAPLLWRRLRIRDAALGVAILAALYIPFLAKGSLPFGSLGAYLALWLFNAPVYSALERILPVPAMVVLPAAVGFVVAIWGRSHFEPDAPQAWVWPMAMTLLFAPAVFPWYLVWVTPFLFAPRTQPLAVWTVSSLAAYWPLSVWSTTMVEYGPVLCTAGWMFLRITSHQLPTTRTDL